MIRLRSTTGCLNCRTRRKKCDEVRPMCRACFISKLLCNFADDSETSALDGQLFSARDLNHNDSNQLGDSTAVASTSSTSLSVRESGSQAVTRQPTSPSGVPGLYPIERVASLGPESRDLGDFSRMDVADHKRTLALARVHRLVDLNLKHMWPFVPDDGLHANVRASWLVPILKHGIFTNGVIAISAGIESGAGSEPFWLNMRRQYETETISYLRANVTGNWDKLSYLKQYLVMCASCHLVWLNATYECDGPTMRQLANGSRHLVQRSGGLHLLWELGRRPELQSLVRCELLASLVNADDPGYLTDSIRPEIVQSLTTPVDLNTLYTSAIRFCGPDAVAVANDLKLLLHYRNSSEQANPCPSLETLHCLTDLLNYVDMQLCALQRRYLDTASVTECFVYTLITVRTEVFEDGAMFPQLGSLISDRFHRAISSVLVENWLGSIEAISLHAWILCIGSLTVTRMDTRNFFRSQLAVALGHVHAMYEALHDPIQSSLHFLEGLPRRFLWHGRLDAPFKALRESLSYSPDGIFTFMLSTDDDADTIDREPHMKAPIYT